MKKIDFPFLLLHFIFQKLRSEERPNRKRTPVQKIQSLRKIYIVLVYYKDLDVTKLYSQNKRLVISF